MTVTTHNGDGVSPFGHPRINALLATPRGITQPHTSFIGSVCQGIHRTPLKKTHNNNTPPRRRRLWSYTYKITNNKEITHTTQSAACTMLASTIQFSHNTTDHPPPPTPPHNKGGGHHRGHEMTGVSRNVLFQTPNSVPTLTCNR